MNCRKKLVLFFISSLIIALAVSFLAYPVLDERIASHWNAQGIADGFSQKGFSLFFIPILMTAMFLLFMWIPKADPLKENIKKFESEYYLFSKAMIFFFLYLHIVTIILNLGTTISIMQFLAPGFTVIFYFAGRLIKKSKRNYLVGVRTPWALADDENWEKTSKVTGKLFKVLGFLCFIGILFPLILIWIILAGAITIVIFSFGYSYLIYTKKKVNSKTIKKKK